MSADTAAALVMGLLAMGLLSLAVAGFALGVLMGDVIIWLQRRRRNARG